MEEKNYIEGTRIFVAECGHEATHLSTFKVKDKFDKEPKEVCMSCFFEGKYNRVV